MKTWTQAEPRDLHLLDGDGYNSEFQALASSAISLDRTQLPITCIDDDNLTSGAVHTIWCNTLTGSGNTDGQQLLADPTTIPSAFQAVTYQNYSGGWQPLCTLTLSGFKGGSLFVEWSGCGYVNGWCHQTLNVDYPGNPKHITTRIVVAGVTVAEKYGMEQGCRSTRLFGTMQFPPGDHVVTVQWSATGPGSDDPVLDEVTSDHIVVYHVWGSKIMAVGRWR